MKLMGSRLSSGNASRVRSLPLLSSSPIESSPTRGCLHAENRTAINLAHHRELLQVDGCAIDVRAHVEQNRRRVQDRGESRRQRRTVHARQRAQHHFGRGHGRARVARSHKARGAPFAHQPQSDADRRIALGANRLHLVVHGDDFAGVNHVNRQTPRAGITRQLGPQLRFRPHQQHADAVMARRLQCAFNLRLRRLVGPHRIECDYARHGGRRELGLLFDLDHFAALVGSALRAGAVRHLPLMAVRTLRQRVLRKRVVSAPRGGALL